MMEKFLEDIAETLEVPTVKPEDDFRAVPGWSSLQGFGLVVLLKNNWETPVTLERFLALKTVRDLYREAFLSFAARLFGVPRETLSGETAYGTIPDWDSVNHLNLAMESEKKFGVTYPLERIPFMKTLDDFLVA